MKPGVYTEYLNKAKTMGHDNEHLDIIERGKKKKKQKKKKKEIYTTVPLFSSI
jgi:hypothetical protein